MCWFISASLDRSSIHQLPIIGWGSRTIPTNNAKELSKSAIEQGILHFDTATGFREWWREGEENECMWCMSTHVNSRCTINSTSVSSLASLRSMLYCFFVMLHSHICCIFTYSAHYFTGNFSAIASSLRTSSLPRSSYFISLKWSPQDIPTNHWTAVQKMIAYIRNSGLQYLDCLMIQWPGNQTVSGEWCEYR